VNVPLRLGRSIAGFGIVGLVVAEFIHLPTSNSQQVVRVASPLGNRTIGQSPRCGGGRGYANANDLPLVPTIVSSDPTSERFRQAEAPPTDLNTTAGVAVKEEPPVQLNCAQIALKEAQVAVSLSQSQLAQARINLREFQAKHDSAKILSAQGKVSRQEADTAKAAYELAQLQHSSAAIGLQDSQAQLIAAKSEVSKQKPECNDD
jgi:hypothetical protein